MTIFASTADPMGLSQRLERAVRAGTLRSWSIAAGHLRAGEEDVFFRMIVLETTVKFVLVAAKGVGRGRIDAATYAHHHGRLTELLLASFSDAITRVQATPYSAAIP